MAIKMVGEYVLPISRENVWAALNDADVIRLCIPSCEEFEKLSETDFRAAARVKIGPLGQFLGERLRYATSIHPTATGLKGRARVELQALPRAGLSCGSATRRIQDNLERL